MADTQNKEENGRANLKEAAFAIVCLLLIYYLASEGWKWYSKQVTFTISDVPNVLPFVILWNVVVSCLVIFIYVPGISKSLAKVLEWISKFLK